MNWTVNEELTIPWNEKDTYKFKVKKVHNSAFNTQGVRSRFKQVAEGIFVGKAPEGLNPGQTYILKKVLTLANDDSHTEIAQTRERYDLIDYAGSGNYPHLREILACCDKTKEIRLSLQQKNDCPSNVECYSVEPLYTALPANSCTRFDDFTAWERLRYVWQYATGLRELQFCQIGKKNVIAHRDVKIENGLIQRGISDFVVRINDMATLSLEKTVSNRMSTQQSLLTTQGTAPFPLSQANTAPEDVLKYKISEKVDVYALGMMLAGFFGYVQVSSDYWIRNPNQCWCTYCAGWQKNTDNIQLTGMLQNAFRNAIDSDRMGGEESWIEIELRKKNYTFEWNDIHADASPTPPSARAEIRKLFIASTHIDPEDRISLDGFIRRIKEIMDTVGEHRSENDLLYSKPAAVYIYQQKSVEKDNLRAVYTLCEQSFAKDGGWIKSMSFLHDPAGNAGARSGMAMFSCHRMFAALEDHIHDIYDKGDSPSENNGNSLTEVLFNLWTFYRFFGDREPFGGTVRIFLHEPLTDRHLLPFRRGGRQITVDWILENLRPLAQNNQLRIYLHSFEKPQISGPEWFTHIPLKKPVSKPDPSPLDDFEDLFTDFMNDSRTSGAPSPSSSDTPPRRFPAITEKKRNFDKSANGLFLVYNEEIVYVSQKGG